MTKELKTIEKPNVIPTKITLAKKKKSITEVFKKNINIYIFFISISCLLISSIILTFSLLNASKINKSFIFYMDKEKQRWFDEHYYLKNEIKRKLNREERKRVFQLRAVGFMKENKTNLDSEELIKYTDIVFEQSEIININPYIPLSVAFIESKFDKKAIGEYDNRGLYKLLPGTVMDLSEKINISYYNGIEFNVIDNTKIWFERIETLLKRFNGNINYALIAFDKGEKSVIQFSKMKINKELGILNTESGGLQVLRNKLYDKNASYDEKIFKIVKEIKNKEK